MRSITWMYLAGALAFSLTAHAAAATDKPQDNSLPPISTGTAKGLTLEQIKASNTCKTFDRLGISVPSKTPSKSTDAGKK